MAWLRNRGRTEPSGEEWAKTGKDSQGKEHSNINYTATLNKQSHVISQRERVFGVRHVTDDHQRQYAPPRINLSKNHGDVVDDHSHFPQSTVYGSPKKAEEFSPKERLRAGRMKNNPFSRDDDHSSTDDSDDDTYPTKDDNYDRHGGYGGSYSPKLGIQNFRADPDYTDYSSESPKGGGRKPSVVPPAGRHQQYTAPVSISPKRDAHHETARNRPTGHSPPRSKPETATQSPETGWKPLFEPTMGRHPQYSAPISTSPKKDARYETASYRPIRPGFLRSKPETEADYAVESPKYGRPSLSQTGYASDSPKAGRHPSFDPPAERKPHHTFPVKDSQYETANNIKPPFDNGKGVTFENPKPKYLQPPAGRKPHHTFPVKDSQYETANNIKPAYDNGKGVTFENPKPKYLQPQLQVSQQPRKEGHQQTIDSSEARKRYGGKAINHPKRKEEEYSGTINCIDAARKYNGVFVP